MEGDLGLTEEILRYSRQLLLQGFGPEGQQKLQQAHVLVAGAGGLGSPALLYLAAAGVGHIGICDFDTVTYSNLNRQVLHYTADLHKKKTISAREKLLQLNPVLHITTHTVRMGLENVEEILEPYDVVIDATDNFPARYLISDTCFFLGMPVIEGAAVGFDGILMTIVPGQTPCYRCLYPAPPEDGSIPTCSDTGILGAATGMLGSLQALEAIKMIAEMGETMSGRLLTIDFLYSRFREIPWSKKEACPLCGNHPTILEPQSYEIRCKRKADKVW